MRTGKGKLHLYVGIDRTSKFAFAQLHETADRPTAVAFLEALLDAVPTELDELSATVRNVIEHYRASEHTMPADTVADIHSRWIARTLELDQQRHPASLAESREPTTRVQGCCRDHTLLSVAILLFSIFPGVVTVVT